MAEPAVETKGLTKRFGAIEAVRELTISIHRGEMFAIVGPDGAGKTTTMRMLCGVTEPTSGTARILGHELHADTEAIKKEIGYLSQRFSLYGDLTVDENIEFFAEIHGVRNYAARRNELLAFTRLTPFRTRLAEKLSGGMKQKLALACTLIHTPQMILLDEPTTGVDPVSRRDFWKILSSLLAGGMTIVLTTPYLDEAERCSRVALMNKGSMMVIDTPQAIKKMMRGTVLEIVCDNVPDAVRILKSRDFREVQAFGDRLNLVIQGGDEQESARHALETSGIQIQQSRLIPPSLENVFISLVKAGGTV